MLKKIKERFKIDLRWNNTDVLFHLKSSISYYLSTLNTKSLAEASKGTKRALSQNLNCKKKKEKKRIKNGRNKKKTKIRN